MKDMMTVAKPYAVAACSYAKENNVMKLWYDNLNFLSKVIVDPEISAKISSSSFSQQQTIGIILDSCDGVDAGFKNFLHILAEKKRLTALPEIKNLFTEFRNIDLNIRMATITVAFEIDENYLNSLKAKLEGKFGFNLEMKVVIDKGILGGIIVQIDDIVIDDSIVARLGKMRQELLSC